MSSSFSSFFSSLFSEDFFFGLYFLCSLTVKQKVEAGELEGGAFLEFFDGKLVVLVRGSLLVEFEGVGGVVLAFKGVVADYVKDNFPVAGAFCEAVVVTAGENPGNRVASGVGFGVACGDHLVTGDFNSFRHFPDAVCPGGVVAPLGGFIKVKELVGFFTGETFNPFPDLDAAGGFNIVFCGCGCYQCAGCNHTCEEERQELFHTFLPRMI